MDEILNTFEGTTISPSNYENLYKNWQRLDKQEERRNDLLETQKSNRNSKIDKCRGVFDLMNYEDGRKIFGSVKTVYRPRIHVPGFNIPIYNNILMLSEWLVEKPSDFDTKWFVVPCPKGIRTLVVAKDCRTRIFTKYGQLKFTTRSLLPGSRSQDNRRTCCILDCMYYEPNSTMYVLDVLAWNNQPMTDCDTEFRNYWLKTQFDENPELRVISKQNKLCFKLLEKVPCDESNFQNFMLTYPHFENGDPALDGLLFYHRDAMYVSGETPLVGWLYPFMVPEVLGKDISLHKVYALEKPDDYVDQADFIMKFDAKMNKKKKKMPARLSVEAMVESQD